AGTNAAIAGSVANDVVGKYTLKAPFYPLDAVKEWDFGLDTRRHKYELKVKWRDLTVAGTLFGTISGTITASTGNCYLDVSLDKIIPVMDPTTGKADKWSDPNYSPLMVSYREDKKEISVSNTKFQVNL